MNKLPFANHKNEIERQILVLLVGDLLAAGYAITVNNGENNVLDRSVNDERIFAAMSTTCDEYLMLHEPVTRTDAGYVKLVYGNGCDVISDYTVNIPARVFKRADELAARFRGY